MKIPAGIVALAGSPASRGFIENLYRGQAEDPSARTDVNFRQRIYGTTFPRFSFCLTLSRIARAHSRAYLARCQNPDWRPALRLAEIGLDSRVRNGEQAQAASLEWQVEEGFRRVAAPEAFVFAWTDDGIEAGIRSREDWIFGLRRLIDSPKLG